ncbi:MAG: S1 family peptidase [Planctomycetota bacterium]|jgi:S1-C subfamily serine protease
MKPDVEDKVKQSTLLVFTKSSRQTQGDTAEGSGSGFFINGTGLAISNNHVVDPSHSRTPIEQHRFHYETGKLTYEVVANAGTEEAKTYAADVLYQNRAADQAILQVYDENGDKLTTESYLRLQPESRLTQRMKVWAMGFPGGDTQRTTSRRDGHPPVTITSGHVTRAPRTPGGRIRMIYTDVEVRPGNSGGPVVDRDGFLVGTATLMTPPEGYEFTGGANYSALVPARLTAHMVRNAFDLRKMKDGTDVTPFMDVLTDEQGHITVPEFKRLADRDMLFFDNGDRIHGTVAAGTISWESEIGTLEIPTDAVAYVMNSSDGAHLFLEGGNHISASDVDAGFQFTPRSGTVLEQKYEDVATVAFRESDRDLQQITGEVIILDTNVCHLVLRDVKGKAKLESRAGTVDVALRDVERIDAEPPRKKVILFSDGSRLTGTFEESQFSGVIAATGIPITFDLERVDFTTVEVVEMGGTGVAGLDLLGVLASADRALKQIARGLHSQDHSGARAELDKWLAPRRFKKLPLEDKEQVKLVEAVALLRDKKYAEAARTFRKGLRAKDENIVAFSQACVDVLKEYDDNRFKGRPLSDNAAFVEAGTTLAGKLISDARDYLKNAELQEGKKRGEYTKAINRTKKLETAMATAAVFRGEVADDELIRLWKSAARVSVQEITRLDVVKEEKRNATRRGSRSGSRRASSRRDSGGGGETREARELREIDEQRAETLETLRDYVLRLYEYGFRIEDPDIQEMKEEQQEFGTDEGP